MELNNLKIEVLKFEDGEEFSVLNDDLIEYVEEPEFIEYEYIETDDHEIKEDEIALQRWEAKHIAIKLDLDSQCHNSREENFRCSNRQCKREIVVFASQEELDVHNILHVRQIDNNTCPICNKVLANAGKLNNHMETRHVPKNYYCDNCGKVFKSKDNLRLHMSHHRIHFLVECKACKKTYKSMQSLRYHLRQHFEHHQCETCGQVRKNYRKSSGKSKK